MNDTDQRIEAIGNFKLQSISTPSISKHSAVALKSKKFQKKFMIIYKKNISYLYYLGRIIKGIIS